MKLTRRDLYELAWSKPMQELAKDFGISDVGLAKQLRKLGIPVPGRGYWARVAAGQEPFQPKLPERVGHAESESVIAVEVGLPKTEGIESESGHAALSGDPADIRSRIVAHSLTPSSDLASTIAAVKKTAKHLRHPRRAELTLTHREKSAPIVSIDVTDSVLDRALLLADRLLRAAEALGWLFTAPPPPKPSPESRRPDNGQPPASQTRKATPAIGHLLVDGEIVCFRIEERMREEPRTPTSAELAREKREYGYHAQRKTVVPTGALRVVRLDPVSRYFEPSRKSWYDRKSLGVEGRVPDILEGFHELALTVRARRIKAQKEAQERAELERLAREQEQRREANAKLIIQLETIAGAWHRARALRTFVRAARRQLGAHVLQTELLGQPTDFVAWAERYINQLDPAHELPRDADLVGPRHLYYGPSDLTETLSRLSGQNWKQSWKLSGLPEGSESGDDD